MRITARPRESFALHDWLLAQQTDWLQETTDTVLASSVLRVRRRLKLGLLTKM
jgi:hypothetical protein